MVIQTQQRDHQMLEACLNACVECAQRCEASVALCLAKPEEGVPADAAEGGEKVTTIVIENGEPVGGIAQLEYNAGEQIRFKVKGDEAEEVHLHGYDVMKDIPQGGGTVEFNLPAEIEGIFEAELEGKGVQILELTVNP